MYAVHLTINSKKTNSQSFLAKHSTGAQNLKKDDKYLFFS